MPWIDLWGWGGNQFALKGIQHAIIYVFKKLICPVSVYVYKSIEKSEI